MTLIQLQECASKTCCSMPSGSPRPCNTKQDLKQDLVLIYQELYDAVLWLPINILNMTLDVWSHLSGKPRMSSWSLQTTARVGLIQALRDQSCHKSIGFWRMILNFPSYFTPFYSSIEDGSFYCIRRNMPGVLSDIDQKEDGTRIMSAEWVTEAVVAERAQQLCRSTLSFLPFNPLTKSPNQAGLDEKIILYIHGGGFYSMSAQTHRSVTYALSKATKRRVFAVNYRLAPENRFPAALYDVVQTYLHLINGSSQGIFDPRNIFLAGDSTGAGLCLSMMLYLRDHGVPCPEGAIFLSPCVDLTYGYSVWSDTVENSVFVPRSEIPGTLSPATHYLGPDDLHRFGRHPYVSPLYADHFEHLPPILIQSGGIESLQGEINELVFRLKAAKTTRVQHEIYEDMLHVFQSFSFQQSSSAMESIGWWVNTGIPLLDKWHRA
ncbi:alpha/beta hydrolase fold-domain-containing protein [Phycomyces nitens]|nr:alpha/beta hydrolase fold-domain-containing protein [Phycomyces nitens]